MNPSVDDSVVALTGLLSFVFFVALYVWSALALSAMFRKMGEEPWKGWVPFLNAATVLKWGGFSPWLVLLVLVPGAGALAVWVLMVLSAHRINPGFGYGGGMTVVAALVSVIWASILGFGPARWLGARAATRPVAAPVAPAPAPARPVARQLPLEEATAPGAVRANTPPAPAAPAPAAPTPDLDEAAAASFAPPPPTAAAWTPPETSPRPATSPIPAAPAAPLQRRAAAPAAAATPAAAIPGVAAAPAVPAASSTAPPEAWPRAASDPAPVDDNVAWPSEIDDVSAIHPSPYPPSSAAGRAFVVPPVGDDGQVGPIEFVPGRRTGAAAASTPAEAPVTRVPATRAAQPPAQGDLAAGAGGDTGGEAGPVRASAIFAPQASVRPALDLDDPDAFPEHSGEVSAVVGSPAAGTPRSAIAAVSAQHRRAGEASGRSIDEVPAAARGGSRATDDDLDETIVARRIARPTWELVPVSGSPIPITATVVILGRRPSADPTFPAAQLVALPDDARTVSKTHARIEQHGETWKVTDLGSTNGVLVRTLMGDEVELEPGGQVDAGERFFLGDEEFHLRHITG